MNYTIAVMKGVHTKIRIHYDKSGNKYIVGLSDENKYYSKIFNTSNEAQNIFNLLSYSILNGLYSFEQKNNILLTGTKEV